MLVGCDHLYDLPQPPDYKSLTTIRNRHQRGNCFFEEATEYLYLYIGTLATRSITNNMRMGKQSYLRALFVCLIAIIGSTQAQLKPNFYAKSCPKAEKIVFNFVNEHIHNAPSLAAALIRMQFHDCFIRGCDASVLLNSTTSQAEKNAIPNLSLRGFDFIDRIKSLVEAECPGVVSCADILSLTARDAIVATGGPFWKVPTGRRDGTVSNSTEVLQGLPAPFHNITVLQGFFANVGLDLKDLVLLSGAHTIGVSHCTSFSTRLYNFTGKGDEDPSLDSEYAANLKKFKCKTISDNTTLVEMDPGSRKTFDLSYYVHVVKRRGLFHSDAALLTNSVTKSTITQLLQGSLENFFSEFAQSMEKLIQINVKTGTQGEIRKHCALVNS